MTAREMPPAARSQAAQVFSEAAAAGRLSLQRCGDCGKFCWPAREACPSCWSADLVWTDAPDGGTVLADSTLHNSFNDWFRTRLPWRIAIVQLDAGPVAVTHLHRKLAVGERTRIIARTDPSGQGVLVAIPEAGPPDLSDDPKLHSLTCVPAETADPGRPPVKRDE